MFLAFNLMDFITVAKIASEVIAPYVKQMDRDGKFTDEVVESLFSNGVSLWCFLCVSKL